MNKTFKDKGLIFYVNKRKNNNKNKQFKEFSNVKIKVKGSSMKHNNIRRNLTVKANAPIVKLMNLIWGL